MRKIIVTLSCILLVGCGGAKKADVGGSTDINNIESSTQTAGTDVKSEETKADGQVDYDLSSMGPDMVYATIYQMMIDPKSYVGKSFKVTGNYYSSYSKENDQYYHFCMVKDAAACCAQGLELLWADDNMNKHENCPDEEALVTVEGVFETYEEGQNTYGRLKDVRLVNQ
ncbi:hypothetical protein [Lachnoanaerobaculum orale]|uniref:hypothetical protein n=1 Tax=Lachnoanaerobaculum orale TaxID=979627 RepID=UPI0023A80272|nr:hypothetical protein [Lachnoanaerobaculum orale]